MLYRFTRSACLLATAICCLSSARADIWCTGYYPASEQNSMPPAAIDFSTLTHVIHFALAPNSDGSLNPAACNITPDGSTDLIARAHAAGRKVLICVGGAGSQSGFQGATTPKNLPVFISNLTNFVAAAGYDGIDLDWEPLTFSNLPAFTRLVTGLRSALDNFPQYKMLTTAVGAYPSFGDPPACVATLFASLQDKFDQINIMTYDLSGPYTGWVTWFNSPIYDGGFRFPSSGGLVPSINGSLTNFLQHGVKASKLGIGIAFYGYVWTGAKGTSTGGVTLPRQAWTTAPSVSMPSYNTIMSGYYRPDYYLWDNSAQAAYLSISNSNPAQDVFISYDDQHTCQAKVNYARNLGLGGLMIWQIAQDHQDGRPDPLLQAVKQSLDPH